MLEVSSQDVECGTYLGISICLIIPTMYGDVSSLSI